MATWQQLKNRLSPESRWNCQGFSCKKGRLYRISSAPIFEFLYWGYFIERISWPKLKREIDPEEIDILVVAPDHSLVLKKEKRSSWKGFNKENII